MEIGAEVELPGSSVICANTSAIGAVIIRSKAPGSTTKVAISSRPFNENSSVGIAATMGVRLYSFALS